jgi:hypothetical protein
MPLRLFHFLLLICALSTSSAIAHELKGDWGSAGDLLPPWMPKYGFQYSCQAELTDNKELHGDGSEVPRGRPYRLYAIARFDLNNAQTSWQNNQSNWLWVAKLLDEGDYEKDESADLFFRPGESSEKDSVSLAAFVKLPLGEYYLLEAERKSGDRRDSSLHVRVNAYVGRENGQRESLPRSLERSLYVVCEKKK